jgi:hypothetical protein
MKSKINGKNLQVGYDNQPGEDRLGSNVTLDTRLLQRMEKMRHNYSETLLPVHTAASSHELQR